MLSRRTLLAALLACASAQTKLSVSISAGSPPVNYVAPEYLSFNLDWHYDGEEWPAWRASSVANMSLSEPNLKYLTAALAPAHLRVGGSEGDLVQYVLPGFPCALPPNQNATANPVPFCLDASRWAAVNAFAAEAKITLAFGLNAMQGRRNASAPMDTANLAAFLRATAAAGVGAHNTLPFLELGNELEFRVNPSIYAADAVRVAGLIADAWPQPAQRPRLVGNDENPDPSYWATMLPLLPAGTLAAASWHEYVGYGLDPALPTKCLDASFLDGVKGTAANQAAAAAKAKFSGALWVGETALAWHSGRNGTTNAFASSFWYVVQLGALAATHAVQCRQTLIGGYYELIDKTTRSPNPDFYTALLWKKTMGTGVLAATFAAAAAPQLRLFAHCTAGGRGVTLAFANLDATAAYELDVSGAGGAGLAAPRDEYHLSAVGGDVFAQAAALNGNPLAYSGPGTLDPLAPVAVTDPAAPLILQPRTLGFVVFPDAENVC